MEQPILPEGQEHIYQYLDELNDDEKMNLYKQINDLNLENSINIYNSLMSSTLSTNTSNISNNDKEYEYQPFPLNDIGCNASIDDKKNWWNIGLNEIKDGKVCALVLSGGQGTRLGYNGPKGMYNIGLNSNKTLFELQIEKLIRLKLIINEKYNININNISLPLYIMTSPLNENIIRNYFIENNYFNYPENDIIFFPQGVLPCFTLPDNNNNNGGKIILKNKNEIAVAPDGNGGIYKAMEKHGIINDMESRGIKWIQIYAVDNALVKPADPIFIGLCESTNSDCGNKIVWKKNSNEKVGVMALKKEKNNINDTFKPCIIEYSEMDDEMRELRDDNNNKLMYGAANLCLHLFSFSFLKNIVLPNYGNIYHIAKKKIPYINNDGNIIKPTENNGIKLEAFIFDIFQMSNNLKLLEILREDEFAPVKNANGNQSDTPEIACQMYYNEKKKLLGIDNDNELKENDDIKQEEQEEKNNNDKYDISNLKCYSIYDENGIKTIRDEYLG